MTDRGEIDLERAILLGLAAEWREALAILPGRLRDRLRRPQFSLSDAERRLGVWDPAREEIRVSRRFALERGWDEVRELLRHEMAHQLADQALDGGAETSHGPAFREACRLLGAHPGGLGGVRSPRRPARRRRRPGAGAGPRAGAQAAGAGFQREPPRGRVGAGARPGVARRHHVDERQGGEAFLSAFAGRPALRHTREEYQLAALVTRTWEAYGIWVPAWVVERERMGTVLELSGTPAQVKLAGYVHEFVRRHIATEWARYDHGRRLGARRRTDFGCGVIEGFRGTLERGGKSPGAGGGRRADGAGSAVRRLSGGCATRGGRRSAAAAAGSIRGCTATACAPASGW